MTRYIQYDTTTGRIRATNSKSVPDDSLPPGVAQLTTADTRVHGGNSIVNLETLTIESWSPPEDRAEGE